MQIGDSYVSDILENTVKTENGSSRKIKWYQFRFSLSTTKSSWRDK